MKYRVKIKPREERAVTIEKSVGSTKETEEFFDFRNGPIELNVINISIDTPVYRMRNCRAYTEQREYIAREGKPSAYFSNGQESETVQQLQHKILWKLAQKGNTSVLPIVEVLKDDGQRENILISNTGVVINGNRRLAAMRELHSEGHTKFSHVKCMVLPIDATADELDDIEVALQARPLTKLEYDWIGDAQLINRQVSNNRTTKQVAIQVRRPESEVKTQIQSLAEANMYLEQWAKKPGEYSLVTEDGEQFFKDIGKQVSLKDQNLQDASRAIAWKLFDNRGEVPGRIYEFNPAFGKLATDVIERFAEIQNIPLNSSTEGDSGEDFAVEIDADGAAIDYSSFIEALRSDEDDEETVAAFIDVCQSAIEADKGQQSAKAALKAISAAHSKLKSVDLSKAGKSSYGGIKKQLSSIDTLVENLSKKIENYISGSST